MFVTKCAHVGGLPSAERQSCLYRFSNLLLDGKIFAECCFVKLIHIVNVDIDSVDSLIVHCCCAL